MDTKTREWNEFLERSGIKVNRHSIHDPAGSRGQNGSPPPAPESPPDVANPLSTTPWRPNGPSSTASGCGFVIVVAVAALILAALGVKKAHGGSGTVTAVGASAVSRAVSDTQPHEGGGLAVPLAPNTIEPTVGGNSIRILREFHEASPGGEGYLYLGENARRERVVIKCFTDSDRMDDRRQRTEQAIALFQRDPVPLTGPPMDLLARTDLTAHVSPFYDGVDLDEIVYPSSGQPCTDLADNLALAAVVAQAVHELHRRGILHGDLHLKQVRVRRVGWHFEPTLIDLDCCVALGMPDPFMVGHPDYLGPNLRAAYLAHEPTKPSLADELFSLGVVTQEILLQRHPKPIDARPDSPELHRAMLGPWPDEPKRGDRSCLNGGGGFPTRVLGSELIHFFRRAWNEGPGGIPSAATWRDACARASQRVGACPTCEGQCVADPKRRTCPYCGVEFPMLGVKSAAGVVALSEAIRELGRLDLGGDTTVSARHCVCRREPPLTTVESIGVNGTDIWTSQGWSPLPEGVPSIIRAGDRLRVARSLELAVVPVS